MSSSRQDQASVQKGGVRVKTKTRSTEPWSAKLWKARLDPIPGLLWEAGVPLATHTTFRIGGPAELFVKVSQKAALPPLLRLVREENLPFALLGHGSNLLAPDTGIAGVVARLSGEFKRVRVEGNRVRSGSAVTLAQLARRMASRGLCGLEALSGFPSTVGGAVVMNAGSYGTEIKDLLVSVTGLERDGRRRRFQVRDLRPSYRRTVLQETGTIVTGATLELEPGDRNQALAKIDELNRQRWQSLPSGLPNAGSIFRNPPGDYAGRLIEACRLKGAGHGGAQISAKHANVIVNTGGATATDVLALMAQAYDAVRVRFDIHLEPEIILVGGLQEEWNRVVGL